MAWAMPRPAERMAHRDTPLDTTNAPPPIRLLATPAANQGSFSST